MRTQRMLLAVLASTLALAGALAAPAAAQETYCECQEGLGPCGNDYPTAIPSGCANSTGLKAFLGPNGSSSVAADDLELVAVQMPAGQPAMLFMGGGSIRVPFGDGVRCVSNGGVGLFRFAPQTIDASGMLIHGPGLAAHTQASFPPAGQIQPGDTWNFQLWYRDPTGPCGTGFNMTNGLGFTFAP